MPDGSVMGEVESMERWAAPIAAKRGRGGRLGLRSFLVVLAGFALAAAPVVRAQVPPCIDADSDGYGSNLSPLCTPPNQIDCNDQNRAVNPGATEVCNGIDDNCNQATDEGFDQDDDNFTSCDGDCDDTNRLVNPRVAERCNGIDDNCNQQIDEGFVVSARDGAAHCEIPDQDPVRCQVREDCPGGQCVGDNPETFQRFVDLPLGAICLNGFGTCTAFGIVVCRADGSAAECNGVAGTPGREGPYGDPTCFDAVDNDCDGLVDHGSFTIPKHGGDTPCTGRELCNGFDDDNDGDIDEDFEIGAQCSDGIGACLHAGRIICGPNGGTICSAVALPPGVEGPAGSARCKDGRDNDCDGVVDFADSDCHEAERCDGIDNDGNEQVDETFPDLGRPCTAGRGPCEVTGVRICGGDQLSTVCGAIPRTGLPEGPQGISCRDEIDNDCDGFTDSEDPNCNGAGLGASCTLRPGNCRDCVGWYTIDYGTTDPEAVVTAELLAIDLGGAIVARLPVNRGDTANLGALSYANDCIVATTIGNRHQVFAPVPMLRVTVENGAGKAEAFCTNTPYLEVLEPAGQVISESEGDVTPVFVAIPLVDPRTLVIMVDGVSLLPAMGLNPAVVFPGGPFDGVANINGSIVLVHDLLVRTAPLGVSTANTLSMTLSNLGCGEHIINITGSELAGSLDHPIYEACYVDDLRDRGTSLGFKIEVTAPAEGSVVGNHPATVNVRGEACHGQEITGVSINRFPVSVVGQTAVIGDGENTGSKYSLPINVNVPVTRLRDVVDNGATSGTLDPGPNRLVAQAVDADANTTYDNVFFAVGPVIPAPTVASDQTAGGPGEVLHAFTVAITTAGMNTFFEALKDRNKDEIGGRVRDRIREKRDEFRPSIDGSCDPWTTSRNTRAEYENNSFSIQATPQDGQIAVRINLPGIDLDLNLSGYCETDCVCAFGGCACLICTDIDINFRFKRTGMFVAFNVTEDRLLNRTPLDIEFNPGDSDNGVHLSGEVDIGCVAGFFLDLVDFIVLVFTFGIVELDLDVINIDITGDDMRDRFGGLDGDPFDLDLVKMRNPDLHEFGARQRESRISDAQITTQGVAVSLASGFEPEPSEVDPSAHFVPGTPLKNAPLPQPPILDAAGNPAGHVTIAISDDVFNQLFSSAVQTGRLRTEFDVVHTMRDFLPDDCETIADEDKRARCIGLKGGDSCDRFCARFDGCEDVCEAEFPYPGSSTQVDGHRRQCCRARRIDHNRNIGGGTTLILHGQMNVPPQLLIDDDTATVPVEVILRSPQVSITLIADRDGDGVFSGADLATIPTCTLGDLDTESTTESVDATECKLWETCLQAEFRFQMSLEEGRNGRPRLQFGGGEIIRHDEAFGTMCGGGIDVPELDFFNDEASRTRVFDVLEERQRDNTPPLDGEGAELGGFVTFQRDRVIAIETQAPADDDGFQDYIGITGNIVANP